MSFLHICVQVDARCYRMVDTRFISFRRWTKEEIDQDSFSKDYYIIKKNNYNRINIYYFQNNRYINILFDPVR